MKKEGECKRANASTTKIMTCILALENGKEDDIVTVSAYAASMPNVQLNIEEGEQYYLLCWNPIMILPLRSQNTLAGVWRAFLP